MSKPRKFNLDAPEFTPSPPPEENGSIIQLPLPFQLPQVTNATFQQQEFEIQKALRRDTHFYDGTAMQTFTHQQNEFGKLQEENGKHVIQIGVLNDLVVKRDREIGDLKFLNNQLLKKMDFKDQTIANLLDRPSSLAGFDKISTTPTESPSQPKTTAKCVDEEASKPDPTEGLDTHAECHDTTEESSATTEHSSENSSAEPAVGKATAGGDKADQDPSGQADNSAVAVHDKEDTPAPSIPESKPPQPSIVASPEGSKKHGQDLYNDRIFDYDEKDADDVLESLSGSGDQRMGAGRWAKEENKD